MQAAYPLVIKVIICVAMIWAVLWCLGLTGATTTLLKEHFVTIMAMLQLVLIFVCGIMGYLKAGCLLLGTTLLTLWYGGAI